MCLLGRLRGLPGRMYYKVIEEEPGVPQVPETRSRLRSRHLSGGRTQGSVLGMLEEMGDV